MKRPRPYIPIPVRVAVARRKIAALGEELTVEMAQNLSQGRQLRFMLNVMRDRLNCAIQLDHDPALILRPFNERTGKYTPDANDLDYLIYREKADHDHKTFGRKPGAERTVTTKGSDIWLKNKNRRLENPKKPKRKIPSRPFPSKQRASSYSTRRGTS